MTNSATFSSEKQAALKVAFSLQVAETARPSRVAARVGEPEPGPGGEGDGGEGGSGGRLSLCGHDTADDCFCLRTEGKSDCAMCYCRCS